MSFYNDYGDDSDQLVRQCNLFTYCRIPCDGYTHTKLIQKASLKELLNSAAEALSRVMPIVKIQITLSSLARTDLSRTVTKLVKAVHHLHHRLEGHKPKVPICPIPGRLYSGC